MPPMSTFSIVAFDPQAEEWGVAVQSKFLAAAAVVSWARAGAGAVATQSYANTSFGPEGLRLMEAGLTGPGMAEALVVSVNTVRTHIQHIYQKLGVHSRHEALTRARDLALL